MSIHFANHCTQCTGRYCLSLRHLQNCVRWVRNSDRVCVMSVCCGVCMCIFTKCMCIFTVVPSATARAYYTKIGKNKNPESINSTQDPEAGCLNVPRP